MTDSLAIALVQPVMFWEDASANMEHLSHLILSSNKQADVWVLPEMFSTGFSMNVDVAHAGDKSVIDLLMPLALACDAAVCGSAMVRDNGKFYNRFYWVEPGGNLQVYDKRHTFRMAGEHEKFTAGGSRVLISYKGWNILPQVCYDLRFPVWSRNRLTAQGHEYDLLLYVANWPERRRQAWNALLPARAIENQAFVAAVNRVGSDGYDVTYAGDSAVYGFLGNCLGAVLPYEEGIACVTLSKVELMEYRQSFPSLLDADSFTLM